ncbi:hypothetical protein [Companilactobacillus jidongensis]|uniref:hypothetical protein n=1 Tax=Companilactobacillus jidongensis TaxID=2486006 RepID=UPI000F7B2361|nr:hypothetical protein [Companilactobacillus jidongensis]
MKKLYKLDGWTLFAMFLILAFMELIQMFLSNQKIGGAPAMGKALELGMYAVTIIFSFAIYYGVMYLVLNNNETGFQKVIFVNIVIGLTVASLLAIIAGLITGKSLNVWIKIVIGLIGNGLIAWTNWKELDVSQNSKIKISVWTAICFVVSSL